MSDILQEAEEMMTHSNGYAPSLITQIVGGLVAEIKRLRILECAAAKTITRRDSDISDLTKERDRWQATAIDERAQRIISMGPEEKFDRYDLQECPKIGYICDENDGYCVLSECPSITFWKRIAAKELGLQEEKIIGGWNHDPISSLV